MKSNNIFTTIDKEMLIDIIKKYFLEHFSKEVDVEIKNIMNYTIDNDQFMPIKKEESQFICKIYYRQKPKGIIDKHGIKKIINWYLENYKIKKIEFKYNEKSPSGITHLFTNTELVVKPNHKKRTRREK